MIKRKIKKHRLPRGVSRVLTSALVLLFVIVILGVVYVYFSGSSGPLPSQEDKPIEEISTSTIKPQKPSEAVPESASVTLISTPVKPGAAMDMAVQTLPQSKCQASVSSKSTRQAVAGPKPAIADDFGAASWNWTISKSSPAGEYSVEITCSYHKKVAVVDTSFTVRP
jgi:hypothetical protein